MTARRKAPHPFTRGTAHRAPTPADRTASRLPTIAALVSALAIVTATGDAHAIVRTADAGAAEPEDPGLADGGSDAADADDTAADATYCDPRDDLRVAGAMPPPRVHGTGCGCGASSDDDSTTAALLATAAVGIALSRRRRG